MTAFIGRREFITLIGGAAAWPIGARAQQPGKGWHIGLLETIPPAANADNFNALRKGLRELGYIEAQNFLIEYRSADGRAESFAALAAELVRLNVDLIVTERYTVGPGRAECNQNHSHRNGVDRQCDRQWTCRQPCPARWERHRTDGDQ